MSLNNLKVAPKKEIAIKDIAIGTIFHIGKLEITKGDNVYHVYEVINGNKYFYKLKESLIDNVNFKLVRV
jgi:hypothetical protein